MTPELAFGQALQEARKAKGLSQEDLAFESGLDRTFISRLENGRRQPTITTIIQIARALDTSATSLVQEMERKLS